MIRPAIAAAAASILLSGCVPMYAPAMRPPIAHPQEVVDGPYDSIVAVKSSETVHGNYFNGVPEFSTRLFSSFDKKTKTEQHAILLVNRYSGRGWRFWESATTSEAQRIPVIVIDRSVGGCGSYGCSHTEQVSAELSAEQVRAAAESGIKIRFKNRNGWDWFAEYSSGEIQYQLHSLKEATAQYR